MVNYDSLVDPVTEFSVSQDIPADVFNGSPRTDNFEAPDDQPLTFSIFLGPTDIKELMGLNFNGENIDSIEVIAVEDTLEAAESTPEVHSTVVFCFLIYHSHEFLCHLFTSCDCIL